MNNAVIRVLVVDDHRLVRLGTSRLLEDIDGFEVVGQADCGEQAIEMVRDRSPDVVLMDVHMPGIGGLEATRRCLRVDPDLKVIVLTIYEEEPYPSKLLKIGAHGYLTKRTEPAELVLAIRKVMAGQRYVSTEIAQHLALKPFNEEDGTPFDQLSSREMQIALMIVNGHKVPEIASSLSLSPKTVNSYRYRIFDKLHVSSDVTLTRLAIKHHLLDAEVMAAG
ncbi:MAG: UvrY/SirA/GacA family response regulator transcription factor [Pseudomonadota bacterium]